MSIIRQLARVANRIDSASTGTFLSKGDSTGDFTTVNYTDLSGRPTTLDSAALTSIVDSAYIQLRQTSAGSGGLDSAGITALVDSNYVVARSPAAASGFAQYEYTATAGQTTFQDSDINGNVMSYTADGIFVFYNGVLIAPTTDYTASDGSSVVLTTGADSGSHVAISKWNIASGGSSSGSSFTWGGDRSVIAGGDYNLPTNVMQYYDITSPANSTDFGDLTTTNYRGDNGTVADGTYGVFGGGNSGAPSYLNIIQYITVANTGNATDFGDLIQAREFGAACGDGTYGLFASGERIGFYNTIEYVTITSPSNSADFGDLSSGSRLASGCNDATYGLFFNGENVTQIDYVTVATTSNASDFGDPNVNTYAHCCLSDATYGIKAGGRLQGTNAAQNSIDYVTIATPSNASDFGDLVAAKYYIIGTSNGTTGCVSGGISNSFNEIDYFTIATPSNASDFGDLYENAYLAMGTSGSPS